jgi:hypothetical protein
MRIEDYQFGRIVIDGKIYTSDVIIFPDRVMRNWRREEGHFLSPADLWDVVKEEPDVLVVGTGNSGMMWVSPKTRRYLMERGIRLVEERTREACKTYNHLSSSGKKVVAALHLTC